MNTRIQVEHTITELVTGIDLVREQVLIAAGEPTSVRQEEIRFSGHAIECRINAEDPASGFLPTPGVISAYREPAGPGVRVDSGVTAGSEIVGLYDPLIAKLCVWDTDREHARLRMLRALEEFVVEGVSTLIGFHRALLDHQCFVEGTTCAGLVESEELAKEAEAVVASDNNRSGLLGWTSPGPQGGSRARRPALLGQPAPARAPARGARPTAARANWRWQATTRPAGSPS